MQARLGAAVLLGAVFLAAGAAPPGAAAEEGEGKPAGETFHFGTSPTRTNVLFESETTVETIHGLTHEMSGTATFDFAAGKGSADLRVPVASLRTGLDTRDEHLRSEDWLDAAKHPEIAFVAKELKRVKADEKGGKETWEYAGSLTVKGTTRDLKGTATVQKVPEELGKKLGRGSWVKVKAEFEVTLAEFGIQVPDVAAAKVSPTWEISVDIFGTTQPPKGK